MARSRAVDSGDVAATIHNLPKGENRLNERLEKLRAEYDSPWKTILRKHFRQCLAFYFRALHDEINWSVPPKFLDKEFEKILAGSTVGKRQVDLLVQALLKSGQDVWLLIHIEVQGQRVPQFTTRLFTYHYRIFDLYKKHPVSIVILSDNDASWRPTTYHVEQSGFRLQVDFPTVKLLDYLQDDEEKLLSGRNPFALVTWAHLQTIAAGKDNQKRFSTKISLIRALYQKGYSREDTVNLFNFIDWILNLPPPLQLQFEAQVDEIKGVKMEYMNPWQEREYFRVVDESIEKGREEGVEIGREERAVTKEILATATRRFDISMEVGLNLMEMLEDFDLEALQDVLAFVGVAKSIDDVIDYVKADHTNHAEGEQDE